MYIYIALLVTLNLIALFVTFNFMGLLIILNLIYISLFVTLNHVALLVSFNLIYIALLVTFNLIYITLLVTFNLISLLVTDYFSEDKVIAFRRHAVLCKRLDAVVRGTSRQSLSVPGMRFMSVWNKPMYLSAKTTKIIIFPSY